jgi:hypothetical protein
MANEPSIRKPTHQLTAVAYDADCQEALADHIDKLLDEAEGAGWNRQRAASAIMYLAAKRLRAD